MALHHDHGHDAHAHGAHGHHVGHDQRPAFMGLLVGGVILFAIMWGTVALTNRQFAGHAAPAPAAAGGTATPAAPAAGH